MIFTSPKAFALNVGVYNLWFGLDGTGYFFMGELESPEDREKRLFNQEKYLSSLSPDLDILFFQEVNPLKERTRLLAHAMDKDFVYGFDNCGVKIFSLGLPWNLHSGLAILARPEYHLKKLNTHTLSGGGVGTSVFCAHLSERRVGLFASITHPQYGKILLVNLHLHHKPGWNEAQYRKLLEEAQLNNSQNNPPIESSLFNKLKHQALEASLRRRGEVNRLIQLIDFYKKQLSTDQVIVGGDFNMDARTGNPTLTHFHEETGLRFPIYALPTDFYSWHPNRNTNTPALLEFSRRQSRKDFPSSVKVMEILEENQLQPALLDLIYVSENFLKTPPFFSPIGLNTKTHLSDHFGYQLQFSP